MKLVSIYPNVDSLESHIHMQKPIAIFGNSTNPLPFFKLGEDSQHSYTRLAEFAKARNLDLRFVAGIENYSQGFFDSYWGYQDEKFVQYNVPFSASVVFLRSRTQALNSEKRVNADSLETICRDKLLTYQIFPDLLKKTILLHPKRLDELELLKGESVVIKPRFGAVGRNVQLIKKRDITVQLVSTEEYIAQEVIDSSLGIEGIVSQRHEMRMYVFNGEIQSVYLRLPAPNSFLSNISQGATVQLIDNTQIPQSAIEVKDAIDAKFSTVTPRLYAIDVMYENGKPWVVELNDMPGLPYIDVQPLTDNFLKALLDLLTIN